MNHRHLKEKILELLKSGEDSNIILTEELAQSLHIDLSDFWHGLDEIFAFINIEIAENIDRRDKLSAVMSRNTINRSVTKLEQIPEYFGLAKSLVNLHLDYNLIQRLPESLCDLSNLEEISL